MITKRYGHVLNDFEAMGHRYGSGFSQSWFRTLYGSTWKFIIHFNAKREAVNVAAVKIVDGLGVRSHNFRP